MAMVPLSNNKRKQPVPSRRRWRRFVWLGPAVTLAAVLICAPPRWPSGDGGARTMPADIGYKATVDQIAAARLLRVRTVRRPQAPPLEQIVIAGDLLHRNPALLGDCRTVWQRWRFSPIHVDRPSRDCDKVLATYMRDATFLAEDMRQPALWELDGDRVTALKSNAHVLVPAGDPRRSWRGRIRYRDQGTRVADAARPTLMLAEVGTHRTLFRFVDSRPPLSLSLARMSSAGAGGEGRSLGIFVSPPHARESIFASERIVLQRLGRAVLVGLPPESHETRFYVDGRRWAVEAGDFDNVSYALIRPSQYLTLEARSGRRLTVQLVETPGSISEVSGGRRIREPSLHDVAQRLEMARVGGDVVSSITGALHLDLQRRLARSMAAGPRTRADGGVSYRGAALLMDGITGEIAAAATYPTDPEQLARADRSDFRRTAWLTTNFNFQPLPVGSAAKVPFAAAITHAHPNLLAMRIPARRAFSSVDGQRMLLPNGEPRTIINNLGAASVGGAIDFNAFIADSNNEYALTLLRRATVAEIDTNWRSTASWAANLWRFACVIPFGLVPHAPDRGWRTVSDHCSPYVWRDANDDALGTNPIATERLNLRMGAIGNDYADFYLDILGGGRSTWTNANLSQAYARILSGRATNPNLARVDRPARRGSVAVSRATWSAVSRGMADALRIGTARALWRNVLGRPGVIPAGVYFYAKTGTSTLSLPARGDGHLLVLIAVRTRTGRPPQRPGEICALKVLTINLQRDASSALELAEQLLDPARGRRYLSWMTQPCPDDQAF